MRKLILLFLLVPIFCLAEERPVWRDNYEKGLQLAAQGRYEEAASFLKMSVADKPISEIIAEEKGAFEYLPYLQLGICYFHMDKLSLAREFFQVENSLAALAQSKGGVQLMKQYSAKVESAGGTRAVPKEDVIRKFERKPYVLNDGDVGKMKEDIRNRCNLPKADEESYPWYYHYELGLAFEGKHDWQRALDSFLAALDHRDQPQRYSRIYGMWFIDYYPYYNIGKAHMNLQNWQCASSAFRLSQMFEDMPRNSPDFLNLQDLLAESESKAKQ